MSSALVEGELVETRAVFWSCDSYILATQLGTPDDDDEALVARAYADALRSSGRRPSVVYVPTAALVPVLKAVVGVSIPVQVSRASDFTEIPASMRSFAKARPRGSRESSDAIDALLAGLDDELFDPDNDDPDNDDLDADLDADPIRRELGMPTVM